MGWDSQLPPGVLTTESDVVTMGSQVRVGNAAQIAAYTGRVGELSFASDTGVMYIHDGSTAGGIALNRFGVAHYQDQKAQNTAGGAASVTTWHTRVLNTELQNDIGAVLAANQVTLPAGTYFVRASAAAFDVGSHRLSIYNATASAYLLHGANGVASAAATVGDFGFVQGEFTLSVASAIELHHYCAVARAVDGLGVQLNDATAGNEVYADLWIERIA